ncbi:MAG: hypothetical protein L6R30_24830 [Thermoanaerobaculia bacterium]|nr:hypothetical protein [Thermoanaerobaculia bacterium]
MEKESKAGHDRLAPVRISRMAFGVRYQPQYGLMALLGGVIDQVLRQRGTPFGPETFPLSETTPTAYRLTDSQDRSLRLSTHDTVLQLPLGTANFERLGGLADQFQQFVLTPLRIAGLTGIIRYGVLVHLTSVHDQLGLSPVRTYLGPDTDARSLSMRFSRRLPSIGALAMKNVNDFRNAIYAIEQAENGSVDISLDYQEYFDPALDQNDWQDRPFPQCVRRAIEFTDRELRQWLEKLGARTEAA